RCSKREDWWAPRKRSSRARPHPALPGDRGSAVCSDVRTSTPRTKYARAARRRRATAEGNHWTVPPGPLTLARPYPTMTVRYVLPSCLDGCGTPLRCDVPDHGGRAAVRRG